MFYYFSLTGQTSYIPFIEKVSQETSIESEKMEREMQTESKGNVNEESECFCPVVGFPCWQWPGISLNRSLQNSVSLVLHCLGHLTRMVWTLRFIIWAIKCLFLPVNMESQVHLFPLCLKVIELDSLLPTLMTWPIRKGIPSCLFCTHFAYSLLSKYFYAWLKKLM